MRPRSASILVVMVVPPSIAALAAGRTEPVSVAAEDSGPSFLPAMSPDGHYLFLPVSANNLVPGAVNNSVDDFICDYVEGGTTLIIAASAGVPQSGSVDGTDGFTADGGTLVPTTNATSPIRGVSARPNRTAGTLPSS